MDTMTSPLEGATQAVRESADQIDPKYAELVRRCRSLVSMSRGAMGAYYKTWDRQYEVYSAGKRVDKDDEKALRERKPTKQTVPLTFAQVQTMVSFCFLLFTQNDDFFAYKPRGAEGFKADEDATTILTRDLRKNQWPVLLYGFLLDVCLFGLGVVKHSWAEEKGYVKVPQTTPGIVTNGVQVTDDTTQDMWQEFLRYQGNRLMTVSPYRFFPDTRLPLTRFQEGEFCASEEIYTRSQLKQMEEDGFLLEDSVDDIPPMTMEMWRKRGPSRLEGFKPAENVSTGASPTAAPESGVVVTEIQIKVIPNKVKIEGTTKTLGKENFPVMYILWVANDSKVVKCEPMGYYHGQFTYDLAQFSANSYELVGQGLAEMADWLQDVITWFINAHITSVKDSIGGKFVYDPTGIDTRALDERSPFIPLKKGAMKSGVDKWIKQLQTTDTTANHMNDVQALMAILQQVTGISDNMMGQYNSGRRSAQESRVVTQGAAGRSKMVATTIWHQAMDPLGQKMLTNLRAGIEMQTFMQILVGFAETSQLMQNPGAAQSLQQRFAAFKSDPQSLIAANDFFAFDGTLESEKGMIAQSLQEMLQVLMTNPQAAQLLDIDPAALMKAIQALRGITNLGDFSLSQNPALQQQMQQQQIQQQQLENGPPADQAAPYVAPTPPTPTTVGQTAVPGVA